MGRAKEPNSGNLSLALAFRLRWPASFPNSCSLICILGLDDQLPYL